MKAGTACALAALMLALAGCSRHEEPEMNVPGADYNRQTGILTSNEGIQVNATSVANGCVAPEDAQRPASGFTPERRREIVACFNAQTAAQLNPQLPRQTDEITRLDRLSAEGPLLTYYFTVSASAASLGANGPQRIEAGARQEVCGQPATRHMVEMGRVYAYRYVDSQGQPIHSFRIEHC